MREQFQEELDAVSSTLVDMAGLVKTAMQNATTALLTADLALAEKVIIEADRMAALRAAGGGRDDREALRDTTDTDIQETPHGCTRQSKDDRQPQRQQHADSPLKKSVEC